MTDGLSLALLAIVGDVLRGLAVDMLLEFRQRHRAGARGGDPSPAILRRTVERTRDRLVELHRGELRDVSPGEWEAAVHAARESLTAARLDLAAAFDAQLDPDRLARTVHRASPGRPSGYALSAPGHAAYDRIIALTCEQLIGYFRSLPEFEEVLQTHTFWRVSDVARQLDELLRRQDRARPDEDGRFAARYAEVVREQVGGFEMFGANRTRRPRPHTFDKYVTLAVARRSRGEPDEDEDTLTGVGIDVANALVDNPRVIIRAGAGAGKTTLLQWLAAKVADRALWTSGGYVPFFVPLRQFAAGPAELPAPEQLPLLIARLIGGEMPAGWASRRLGSGRALVLVDGVDELPAHRREEARRWLGDLVRAYPNARYVVTSRPPAIDDDWLGEDGFVPFDLLSLSAQGIQDYLGRWHEAAAEEFLDDPAEAEWLRTCRAELGTLIAARPELRRLAANPLLAGLICALFQDRHMHLPRDRKALYDAALELLVLRWDERKGMRLDDLPPLNLEEQVVVLQRLAYSLVKNQDIVLDRAEAVRRIGHAMHGLRPHHADPDRVLQRTLERTGMLREVYDGQIQFVHRTFRDFLAAKEAVEGGDLGLLLSNAHLDQWHDVVIMAVAHARPHERERILRDLLAGNAAARERPQLHDRLRLLAAACLEQAAVTHTDEIREEVRLAARRLIPPASLDDAELLARAGRFVLELLPGPAGLSEEQAACVVRTAAMIGGEGAREIIEGFTAVKEAEVIEELLRAWRLSGDPEGYARTVLADVDFGDRRLEIQRWSRVQYLRYLTRLSTVACRGDTMLDPLAAIPNLRHLELLQNLVVRDLTPLRNARRLRVLHLASCPLIRDLGPLRDTGVTDLRMYLMSAPLETLAGASVSRLEIRDRSLVADLSPIPDDLPLTDLVLNNRPPDRSLRGAERWPSLTHVEFHGTPDRSELRSLAALPHLTAVTLHTPDSVDGLHHLLQLPSLEKIVVHDLPSPDRTAMQAVLDAAPQPTIIIDGLPLR
ncbi:hypothetical protein J2S43_003572 [Catenuloplanes nepalensis]|uniref:NACHT domain-containing protein n=1 Tax=Catenuloplanes nepalensis TaxID=587533 RepID=A0ABT9MUJ0_9ACTN|nr:NACHT domain-containing protein [Catenuloplanes nepalensis]MDP9795060.1 hypothetical protein [Catenuloplanes nepalensis]